MSCDLAELLTHPSIRDKAEFWAEFSAHPDGISDDALRALYRKYGVDSPATEHLVSESASAATQAASSRPMFTLSKQALKDTRFLKQALKKHLDEFLDYAKEGTAGLQRELRKNPGRWNYKQLHGRFSQETHSVRLDGGTRVVFRQNEDGLVEILNIDSTTTH
jgi:hypothetical protein